MQKRDSDRRRALVRRGALFALCITGCAGVLFTAAWLRHAEAHVRISTDLSWSEDIRPIIRDNCMGCHSPGGMAPGYIDLTTYGGRPGQTGVRDWAKAVEEELMTGRMPPWRADDRFGRFSNARSLTKQELDYIVAWAGGGAPQGPRRDLPAPEEILNPDWKLGEPDVVIEMPEDHVIPAGTRDGFYRFEFKLPENFGKDADGKEIEEKYITGYEFRPGASSVVHTILAFIKDPPGVTEAAKEVEVQKPYDPLADEDELEEVRLRPLPVGTRFLGQWIRGDAPVLFPDEAGLIVRPGSTIELRIIYRKSGLEDLHVEFTDRSTLGLFFAQTPVELLMESLRVANDGFVIPAGASEHKVTAEAVVPESFHLTGINPHLGMLARSLEILAHYPDGKSLTLLWVPEFSHKWASSYVLEEPADLPAGTRLEVIGTYDNSAGNRDNFNRPPADVTSGWGPKEERLAVWFDYYLNDHLVVPTPSPTPAPRRELRPGEGMIGGFIEVPDGDLLPEGDAPTDVASAAGAEEDEDEFEFEDPSAPRLPEDPENPDGPIHWCAMRGNPCGLYNYKGPGKCPECKMTLNPREEILASLADQLGVPFDRFMSAEYSLDPTETMLRKGVFLQPKRWVSLDERSPNYKKEFATPGLDPDTGAPLISMGHMDHSPVHGGILIMADNNYHHVEATLFKPFEMRLYFYDDWKQPLDPRNFSARVIEYTIDENGDEHIKRELPFRHPRVDAPYLLVGIPPVTKFPAEIRTMIWMAGEEKLVDWWFDKLSVAPEPDPALQTPPTGLNIGRAGSGVIVADHSHTCPPLEPPDSPVEVVREIGLRYDALKALVASGDYLSLHCPAEESGKLAVALRRTKHGLRGRAVGDLNDIVGRINVAQRDLEEGGHLGSRGRVERAFESYENAWRDLLALFPDAAVSSGG